MKQNNQDYDSPWKDILEVYFREFLKFFFPKIEKDLDWKKGYVFLDKEFQSIVKEAKTGRRHLDKLISVYRKNNQETWLLIHIEVQGTKETDFSERMYVYNYRTYDRYRRPVASLAVLTDETVSWRPERFVYEIWGCEASLCFPVVKILDYNNSEKKLLENTNPFAIVVLSQLKAMETRNDPEARTRLKFDLVKRLYQKGYKKKDVVQLFSFIDWIMSLPEELSQRFWDKLISFEEEYKMPYVTSVEKIGIEKGMQQGMQQGIQQGIPVGMLIEAREMIIEVLTERFGRTSAKLSKQLENIDSREKLKALHRQALRVKNINEFENRL
ncbi:hypothetical protein BuS5_00029 [Desulfosarcina sp. BuS5]|uniref:hypothetical protein n=1 Tax=Desulfosarcina sp. BuS5 TaxID=933262 RepID=UPI0023791F63|nr:hypothetical protein [Desulfosarcina sp. BuS5]WDN87061.1 hypothetical protein BuS5_00029 [Desulfosarcina sp. BuS5]